MEFPHLLIIVGAVLVVLAIIAFAFSNDLADAQGAATWSQGPIVSKGLMSTHGYEGRSRQFATTLDDYIYTSDDQLVEGEVEEGSRD